MSAPESPFLIFDFCGADSLPKRLVFRSPVAVVTAQSVDEVRSALRAVEAAANDGYYAAGYVSYEASPAFDSAFSVVGPSVMPLVWFGVFEQPEEWSAEDDEGAFTLSEWSNATSRTQFSSDIAAIHEAIGRGDTYQVNYTMRLRARFSGDDYAFYRRLRSAQKSQYCAYLNLGRHKIVSASPELFFHKAGDEIITRPMKGTAPRGRWLEEDIALERRLKHSEKDRAENVMIVDLLRNDLGRIARIGSVNVPQLFEVEKYPTVYQMTSAVQARARPETTLEDIFAALFPCGSITGAPKISTMKLISQLETTPREIYCGAIGFIRPLQTEAVFSVAIRTAWIDAAANVIQYGVGGGITWDSQCQDEYEEAMTKAMILGDHWPEFSLLETLRLDEGGYWLRSRHLDRLAASAKYFDVALDQNAIRSALDLEAQAHSIGRWRVRLLVSTDGGVTTESYPLPLLSHAADNSTPVVGLARSPVSRHNRFLYHKTTHRSMYRTHREESPEVFDVLLWNEHREITEFTIGNAVVEIGGNKLTPPVDCGLLAGVFRAELLETGAIAERVVTIDDLKDAAAIWLINSVRGWVRVSLKDKFELTER